MKDYLPPADVARAALAPLVHGHFDRDRARRLYATHTWSCLIEPGDGVAGRLIAALGCEDALAEAIGGGRDGAARDAAGISPAQWKDALARWRPRLDVARVREALEIARRSGVSLITPEDPEWPATLSDLGEHAPLLLWVRGDVTTLRRLAPSVALVGARAATSYGEHVSMELAAELVARGVAIVSGAAYGIDGAAHRAALSAGGTTIALLAGGVERPYPAGHSDLIARIAASGAVVSEVPCGSAPTKWRFLQRNRLIAALADATVVVEAGWRSGSLNTAGHAAALARPLGAVPGPVTSAASTGCHRLLRDFDARCITNADDVLELVGAVPATLFDMPDDIRDEGRTDDTTRVKDAMSFRAWRDPSDIARRSGLAVADVDAILGLLALEGAAERGDSGWRRGRSGVAAG
ncbi:DNA processing protein [Microbacterium sp. cf046]|uniref:DNA-processing protein DprA n=1 Tax=Microbacterium sp. cf046 TaxID=1761803 RepID=UPI0008E3D9B2|nr:DNA-processing protein DprA [Microbacterium sp. cf046]SFS06434.1 DNA processing protein [Microbacterium sp. cf046]